MPYPFSRGRRSLSFSASSGIVLAALLAGMMLLVRIPRAIAETVLPPERACIIETPNGGERFGSGETVTIRWRPMGRDIGHVALFWTLDEERGWNEITPWAVNTSEYVWSLPAVGGEARVRVECLNKEGVIMTGDESNAPFQIGSGNQALSAALEMARNGSPYIPRTSLVRETGTSVVYDIDKNGNRHAFVNDTAFKSWYAKKPKVRNVSAQILAEVPIGEPILPRPGTYWIKTALNPKTYYVDPGTWQMRWITDENVALLLGGPEWSRNIIELEPQQFAWYTEGDAITTESLQTNWPVFVPMPNPRLAEAF